MFNRIRILRGVLYDEDPLKSFYIGGFLNIEDFYLYQTHSRSFLNIEDLLEFPHKNSFSSVLSNIKYHLFFIENRSGEYTKDLLKHPIRHDKIVKQKTFLMPFYMEALFLEVFYT